MRKLALLIILISTNLTSNGQKISCSGYLGISSTLATTSSKGVKYGNQIGAPDFGILLNYNLSKLSFRTGLLYNRNQFRGDVKINDSVLEINNVNISSIRIPINVEYTIPIKQSKLFVFGGPFFGYYISGKEIVYLKNTNFEDELTNATEQKILWSNKYGFSNPLDYGFNVGLRFELISDLSLSLQYTKSFQKIVTNTQVINNPNAIQFGLGVKFFQSKKKLTSKDNTSLEY